MSVRPPALMPVSFAALAGVLLALSFPRYGHPAVAFVALVPLLVAVGGGLERPARVAGIGPARAFRLGLLTGVIHFAGTVYWTGATVRTFGGLPLPVAILAAGLLVMYLALYVAAAAAATAVAVRRAGAAGLMLAPAAWVAFEYLRGHLFGGFPWIPLGNTMVTVLPLAQLASVTGVYGLSLLVALVNAGVAAALVGSGRVRVAAIAVPGVVLAACAAWGAARVAAGTLIEAGTPVRVGLIQGNIAQVDKWNPDRAEFILDRYLDLTDRAVRAGAELVVWPESSTPFFFEEDGRGALVRDAARRAGVPLLLGSDEIERASPVRYYNAAFMLDPTGATAAIYRKVHLVPFGEYVPFERALFFVAPLVEAVSAFSPGAAVTLLPVGAHQVSAAICYEVTYPELMREAVARGSELLTTITNDAWYGQSSAPYQHFEMAAMRAIEQGRYLVRAANTGITGVVDPYGRILARAPMFEATPLVAEARFVRETTLYARMGDWVAAAAMGLTLATLAAALVRRSR